MEELTTYTLEEISIGKGTYGIGAPAIPFDKNKRTYLRITDIKEDGTLNKDGLMSVEEEKADEYLLAPNDIVFARTGNSTGRTYFYEESDGIFCYAGFLIKFTLNPNKVNPRILKYYTHSKAYYDWVHSFDTGGTRGNINAKTYGQMPVTLPSKERQDRIVEICKSLDDKIEVNKRINDNLEQQAQALFKSWFVDFDPFKDRKFVDSELGKIPEGWKVGYLSEIADIIMGQSPNGSTYNENGEGIIFYQGRAEFGTRFPSIRLFTTNPTRIAPANSILISVRAPVGDINITHKECCIGRGLASAVSRTNKSAFLLYTLFSLKSDLDKFNAEGTVFGSINRKALETLKILIPTNDIISKFEAIVASMDQQILTLHLESENLKILRDTLLPKLMSGERSVIHKENNDD